VKKRESVFVGARGVLWRRPTCDVIWFGKRDRGVWERPRARGNLSHEAERNSITPGLKQIPPRHL
jgi:hypothetical protein